MITTLNFSHSGVSRIALLTIACTLAMSGSTLAESITVDQGEVRTTTITATGDGTTVTNNGTIMTTGGTDAGIFSDGPDATISNTGSISTVGTFAYGISTSGADAMINSSGTIMTTGGPASGIFASGADAVINISGTITTAGATASGIFASGADAVINISGTITTADSAANGILASGENAVINISGSVSVTGENAYAVKGSDEGDQTLNLLPGARITGRINLGSGGNDVVNILGRTAGASQTYTFEGAEEVNTAAYGSVLRSGDTLIVIDATGSSATRRALGSVTGQIHRQVSQRLAFTPTPQVTQGAGAGGDRRGWGTFFGSRSERGDDGRALAWKHNFQGLVLGYDADIESGQRVGLFAGFGQDKIKTSEITSITDSANRGFVGIYGQHVTGNLTLNGALVFGRARHKSTRTVFDNITGTETANGSYNSTTISPSLSLTWSHTLPNGFELRPSAQIAYTYGSYSGYTETGTTGSNLTFGKRSVNMVDTRLQMALAQPLAAGRGAIEWRGGVTATHYGNNSASAQLGSGDATSYAVPGDRSLFGGFVGATLHYAIKDRVSLNSSVEYARTSGGASDGISGQLALEFKF